VIQLLKPSALCLVSAAWLTLRGSAKEKQIGNTVYGWEEELKRLDDIQKWLQQPQSDPTQEKVRLNVLEILHQLMLLLRNPDLHQNILNLLSDLLKLEPPPVYEADPGVVAIFRFLKQLQNMLSLGGSTPDAGRAATTSLPAVCRF
jgi:hypothetical protein